MNDPTIVTLLTAEDDMHWWAERREGVTKRIPVRYRDAVVSVPELADWVRTLVEEAGKHRRMTPQIGPEGPSLLLVGATGTGKTHQAYGAIRALSVCGATFGWTFITAADLYARLRPRPSVDAEAEFERFARTGLLILDDLGAAKGSEWNEEINYRLINYRYEYELPTLITSNVRPSELGAALGERVSSRLVEMAQRVVLKGADRRRTPKEAA